eukprot:g1773.t1
MYGSIFISGELVRRSIIDETLSGMESALYAAPILALAGAVVVGARIVNNRLVKDMYIANNESEIVFRTVGLISFSQEQRVAVSDFVEAPPANAGMLGLQTSSGRLLVLDLNKGTAHDMPTLVRLSRGGENEADVDSSA